MPKKQTIPTQCSRCRQWTLIVKRRADGAIYYRACINDDCGGVGS